MDGTGSSGGTGTGFAVRPVGDLACIVELPDLERVLGVAAHLRELRLPGVRDIVPATCTVLVNCEDRRAVRRVVEVVAGLDPAISASSATTREVVIEAHYSGEDLAAVAELTGLSVDGVIAAHTGAPWRAAFGGFAPGFVYLVGGDERLRVPRLDSPRTSVPEGSVAIAGEFSAVYPSPSPGGWRLLGRTAERLWDTGRQTPALIAPGDSVRFRAVRELIRLPGEDRPALADAPQGEAALTVLDPGLLAVLQDGGRPGHAELGVTGSGALDRGALRRANAAVGNPAGAVCLESVNGGLVLRAERDVVVAVAAADGGILIEGDAGEAGADAVREIPVGSPAELRAGERLRLGAFAENMRGYVAVRGGIVAPPVLGSPAHDSLSGLGTPPLSPGDALHVGPEPEGLVARVREPIPEGTELRFVPGPRDDWFTAEARTAFSAKEWTVTPRSNRIGLRFDGAPLERESAGELPTEGMVSGSIQVPPSGLPVLFLADHPVTGGYPVIGTVVDADLDRAGQLRPGDAVRFVAIDPDDAGSAYRPVERDFPSAAVDFSIEVDGRRTGIRVGPATAATLERLIAAPEEAPLRGALAALIAALPGEGRRR